MFGPFDWNPFHWALLWRIAIVVLVVAVGVVGIVRGWGKGRDYDEMGG
jgi:hypothetical protein